MDTDSHRSDVPHADITFQVIGAAMEVLNAIGHGLNEKPYENALRVELALRGVRLQQQQRFEIRYKGVTVGEFVPDLIIEDAVVVDTKVIEAITDVERGQMLNYLRITGKRLGLIVNFRRPKLHWERVIL